MENVCLCDEQFILVFRIASTMSKKMYTAEEAAEMIMNLPLDNSIDTYMEEAIDGDGDDNDISNVQIDNLVAEENYLLLSMKWNLLLNMK